MYSLTNFWPKKMIEQMPKVYAFWNMFTLMEELFHSGLLRTLFETAHD
jgi:hypothetical protein